MLWFGGGLGWACVGVVMRAVMEIAKAEIRAAKPVPETKIEAIISPISGVVFLMMGRGNQPAPCKAINERARENFPAHMVGGAHDGHNRQNQAQHSDMDGQDEDQCWDDEGAR